MLKIIYLIFVIIILYFYIGWEVIFSALILIVIVFLRIFPVEHLKEVMLGAELGGRIIRIGLFLLSLWVISLIYLARVNLLFDKREGSLKVLLLFSILLLMYVFISLDLFLFYLSFEGILIPTYILIVGWGYQPERLQAGLYLIFYTLIASLPLLVVILFLYQNRGRRIILYYIIKQEGWSYNLIYFGGVIAFFVKIPLFIFHLWLPKAHVEAPIAGSILLAGVLLKIGGYGLYRLSVYFCCFIKRWGVFWISFGLIGGVYLSLVCLRQRDIKSLIAYSSVVHIGLVVGGLTTLTWVGLIGSYILIFGHGLCSSGLFCLANVNYGKIQSRSLLLSKGLIGFIPRLSLLWFLLVRSNMACPPSLNLLGEITLIRSILGWGYQILFILILLSFLRASYCLYLFSFTQHGESSRLFGFYNINIIDYLLVLLHWAPLNLLFLKGEMFYLYLNSLIKN